MNICSVEGCDTRHHAKGFCSNHYSKEFGHRYKGICNVSDCERSAWARQMCGKHYQRWYQHGGRESIVKKYNYKNWHESLNKKSPLWENDCFIHGIGCKPQEYAWLELMCDEPLVDNSGHIKFDGLSYCHHEEHYAPMCKKSHNRMDDSGMNNPGIGLEGLWNEVTVEEIPGEIIAVL